MTPARGLCLIRKPDVESRLPGGLVDLLDKTVSNWVQGQAIVEMVGPPALPDEDDEIVPIDHRLMAGAWVLTKHRNWVATDQPDRFVIRTEDIVAVFG